MGVGIIFMVRLILNQENIYWLFSSSAQTISAFIAFLIAGYALVLSVMSNLEQQDESLIEIHTALRKQYYSKMKGIVYSNGNGYSYTSEPYYSSN